MKTTLIAAFLYSSIVVMGQDQNKKNNTAVHCDWPITVKSNKKEKSDGVVVNFVPVGTTWNHRIITYFFQTGTSDITGDDEKQGIRDGFALWAAQTDLYFVEACDDAADIVFLWGGFNHGDDSEFDGSGGAYAHTLGGPPPNIFGDRAGEVHFDESETWTLDTRTDDSQPMDLITFAAHEIGHALGLNHSDVAGTLMHVNFFGNGSHRFLSSDDIDGIQSLYGLPQANVAISGPSTICSEGATFTLNGTPTGASVVWSASSNISINSSTGSSVLAGNGSGWVRANVSFSCGQPYPITKNIFNVGLTATASGTSYVPVNSIGYYDVSGSCGPTPYSYDWFIKNETENLGEHYFIASGSSISLKSVTDPSLPNVTTRTFSLYARTTDGMSSIHNSTLIYITTKARGNLVNNEELLLMGQGPSEVNFSVFPNPSSAYFDVSSLDESNKYMIKLFNNQGKLVLEEGTEKATLRVDTKPLSPGPYTIQIIKDETIELQHIFIE